MVAAVWAHRTAAGRSDVRHRAGPAELSLRAAAGYARGSHRTPSFFSACVMTMVFFAFVDPLALRDMTFPELDIPREFGYSVGFFMF